MAPRFEDIPAELLVNITSYLSTPDYGNVRRTCSMVEKKLFDSFGKEFFKRKQFMLTRLSLQALIDISNHESLRLYLTKVIIGTNLIPHPGKPSHSLYRSHVSNAPLNGQTRSWQREQYLDQRYLIDHGLDTTMLEEALNNLPFCHEIEIRDVWSPDRGRGNEKWTSYGSTDFLNRSGHSNWPWWSDPSNHGRSQHAAAAHSHPWVHHVFSAVTTAMASVGNSSKFTAFMITTRLNDNDLDEGLFSCLQ
jgi:hypothetical protein